MVDFYHKKKFLKSKAFKIKYGMKIRLQGWNSSKVISNDDDIIHIDWNYNEALILGGGE